MRHGDVDMTDGKRGTMFALLQEINRRPEVFSRYTAEELWTDEHTSSQMLSYHLDPTVDLSSRRLEFIDRSATWIIDRFGLAAGTAVADFGCGPGLYTSRLARSGASVTGIDFSASSIRYAQDHAEREGLSIDYLRGDYLEFESPARFDLILMIMCDFCALGPDQRRAMLDRFRRHLKPGGALLFDVYSLAAFDERDEGASYEADQLHGFWSPDPYYGFVNTFKYDEEKVVLDRYTIIEEARTRTVYNWLKHFEPDSLAAELEEAGLHARELLGDVTGAPLEASKTEFAVIAHPIGATSSVR